MYVCMYKNSYFDTFSIIVLLRFSFLSLWQTNTDDVCLLIHSFIYFYICL
jgi:hypothetical protein